MAIMGIYLEKDTMGFYAENKSSAKSTYPKVKVQWLSQALCFYSSIVLVDPARAGLRNPPERKAR